MQCNYALKGQKYRADVDFCPYRARTMLACQTQGAASLALGYGIAGLSARIGSRSVNPKLKLIYNVLANIG